jgi:hypothetical protein
MRPKKYIKFHHYFIDFNKTKPQHTSTPPSEGRPYDGLSEITELTAAGGSAYFHHDGFVGLCSPYT